MSLSEQQVTTLLHGINTKRVAQRAAPGGRGQLSYLEAWDVKAHLIRVFGFCGWSADVLEATLAFEDAVPAKSGNGSNWNVAYKVVLRLTIHDGSIEAPLGAPMATYTEAAIGNATLPSRGDAHDMAIKTAESDALKRAAINLGDQFGLSLYNNGSTAPCVKGSLAHGFDPAPEDEPA